MLDKLRADKLEARKSGNKPVLVAIDFILTDLNSKRARIKVLTVDELDEKDIIKSIEKERDAHKESLAHTEGTPTGDDSVAVITYLESLLPTQLTKEEIKAILVANGICGVEPKAIGTSMKRAKEVFEGEHVDMAIVSSLVRGA